MNPSIKLARAKLRMDELQDWIDRYFSASPYRVATRINSEKRPEYYLLDIIPIPIEITLLASEVLQNLRSALDHSVYKAFKSMTENSNEEGFYVQFPIADDEQSYNKIKSNKIGELPVKIQEEVDKHRPYKEGNLLLWQLNKLNNIDKHRLLVTVGSRNSGVDIMPTLLQTMSSVLNPTQMTELSREMKPMYLQPSFEEPLKSGDVLFVDLPEKSPSRISFQFFITLHEPNVIQEVEIKTSLDAMYAEVSKIVKTIDSMLTL